MNNLRRLDLGLAVVAALVSVGGLAGAQQQKGPRGVGPKDIEKLQALIDDYKTRASQGDKDQRKHLPGKRGPGRK